GCSGTTLTKAQTGAIIGGVTGAVIGKSTSNHDTKRAVIGGAVGAAAGAAIGAYMDRQEKTLRDSMQGTGIEVERQGDNIILNMPDSITFDTAKSDLKPQFHPVLNSLASTLNQYDQTKIKIAGHTDSRGSLQYNQNLSQQRANSVRNFLAGRGVNNYRIYAHGYGETKPVSDNTTDIGMAKNRRVEITLVPVEQPQPVTTN
ncbi:MAG: OmpA family protein, partial [Thiotrichaceae bacterium]